MKRTTNYFKVLVFALVIALAFVFVGCGEKESSPKLSDKERKDFVNEIGGASETFTGATSKEVYQTKEDAAKAFIAEEVVGNGNGIDPNDAVAILKYCAGYEIELK